MTSYASYGTGETTGRYVVLFSNDARNDPGAISRSCISIAGVADIANSLDFEASALDVGETASADATIFAQLGCAVMQCDPSQFTALNVAVADDNPRILAVEPERILHAIEGPSAVPLDYVRGYRDGIAHLSEKLCGNSAVGAAAQAAEIPDDAFSTWGLKATKAVDSGKSGQGIRVAVLGTGFDLDHPDFAGRVITQRSFVPGEPAQDGHDSGTHSIGTSCGALRPAADVRRYGIAHGADIYAGKVLNNAGSGTDASILAGIEWAIANGCRVICLLAGGSLRRPSVVYETVGRRALAAGSLIIAAPGHNANRSTGDFGFVGSPANCPSIMAVGALDNQLRIANFSPRSNPVEGGQIDIVGPGVAVFSSSPMPARYRTISGTSSATAHVAGLAALWSQATGSTGEALWSILTRNARRLDLPSVDVGSGLVQAPQ
ncbi:MAG: S8 family serine peptidase [Egibacteraceae bacterium]